MRCWLVKCFSLRWLTAKALPTFQLQRTTMKFNWIIHSSVGFHFAHCSYIKVSFPFIDCLFLYGSHGMKLFVSCGSETQGCNWRTKSLEWINQLWLSIMLLLSQWFDFPSTLSVKFSYAYVHIGKAKLATTKQNFSSLFWSINNHFNPIT